jgi:hypothetical protein
MEMKRKVGEWLYFILCIDSLGAGLKDPEIIKLFIVCLQREQNKKKKSRTLQIKKLGINFSKKIL